jgi:hypothetical protein
MRRKLGLLRLDEGPADDALAAALLDTMAATGADWTNTFRRLAMVPLPPPDAGAGNGGGGTSAADAPAGADGSGGGSGAEKASGSSAGAAAAGNGAGGGGAAAGYPDGGFLAATLAELASVEEMARGAAPRIPEANLQVCRGGAGQARCWGAAALPPSSPSHHLFSQPHYALAPQISHSPAPSRC